MNTQVRRRAHQPPLKGINMLRFHEWAASLVSTVDPSFDRGAHHQSRSKNARAMHTALAKWASIRPCSAASMQLACPWLIGKEEKGESVENAGLKACSWVEGGVSPKTHLWISGIAGERRVTSREKWGRCRDIPPHLRNTIGFFNKRFK